MSLALAMMTAGYVTVEATVEPVKVREPKTSKVRAKREPAPIAQGDSAKVTMPGLLLPEVGTHDAPSFLAAVRNAGRRLSPTGKPIFDKSEERNDIIKACAGFIGWDPKESYAGNLLRCTGEARKATAPIAQRQAPLPEYSRGTKPSLDGFIAGLPDQQQHHIANLLAQEVKATEAMLAWSKVRSHEAFIAAVAEHLNAGGSDKAEAESKLAMIEAVKKEPLAVIIHTAAEFSMVERQRLDQIRKDLAAVGV